VNYISNHVGKIKGLDIYIVPIFVDFIQFGLYFRFMFN